MPGFRFPVSVKCLRPVKGSCRSREKKTLVPRVTDPRSCFKMCTGDQYDRGRYVEPLSCDAA